MKPKRVQRKRTKGWRMPENTVAVTRPSEWGNPFKIGHHYKKHVGAFVYLEAYEGNQDETYTTIANAEEAVAWYRWYMTRSVSKIQNVIDQLSGKDLACWCPLDQPCHADVLLEITSGKF